MQWHIMGLNGVSGRLPTCFLFLQSCREEGRKQSIVAKVLEVLESLETFFHKMRRICTIMRGVKT